MIRLRLTHKRDAHISTQREKGKAKYKMKTILFKKFRVWYCDIGYDSLHSNNCIGNDTIKSVYGNEKIAKINKF